MVPDNSVAAARLASGSTVGTVARVCLVLKLQPTSRVMGGSSLRLFLVTALVADGQAGEGQSTGFVMGSCLLLGGLPPGDGSRTSLRLVASL